MIKDQRQKGRLACATVADLPYRYLGHLLILSLALLVAFFGGWQRSVNVDALGEASRLLYVAEEETYLPPPSLPSSSLQVDAPTPVAAPSQIRMRPLFFITAQNVDRGQVPTSQAPAPTAAPAAAPASAPELVPMSALVPRPEPVVHAVAKGDTLVSLAERYGISIDTLRWSNRLDDPDSLALGQQLVVLPVSGVLHTVRDGDTLNDLAARYRVEASAIADYNQLGDADRLALGEKLIVPGGRMPDPVRARPSARGAVAAPAPSQPSAPTAAAPPRSPIEVDVVNVALEYLGYPYVWGGASPRGFDCSGFVTYVFRQEGVYLSRDLWGMMQAGAPVGRDSLRPGDLVFFQNTYTWGLSHVGIYMGGGRFVNAKDESSGVTVSDMNSGYWASRYYGARRVN